MDSFPLDLDNIKSTVYKLDDDSLVTLAKTFEALRQSAYLIKNCDSKTALITKIEDVCVILERRQREIINKHCWRS